MVLRGDELLFPDHSPEELLTLALAGTKPAPCLCLLVYEAWEGLRPGFLRELWIWMLPERLREALGRREHERKARGGQRGVA